MDIRTRKLIDKCFSIAGMSSITLMSTALIILMAPIVYKGAGAFIFRGTVEHRRLLLEKFERGNRDKIGAEIIRAQEARKPVHEMIEAFKGELKEMSFLERRKYTGPLSELEEHIAELLGPEPDAATPVMVRDQFGQARWERAKLTLHDIKFIEEYDYSDSTQMGKRIYVPRIKDFEGTSLEPLFVLIESNAEQMLLPKITFYWGFLFDNPLDSHMLGGIWPEILGTIYLTIGAMIFAVPMGVIAAIYLVEYAKDSPVQGFLRVCISTLAGVPSIVFGLFGLAFFINTLHVSPSKSVLAGSLTLALLILPTIIRASEEAIRAVPQTYREAALSLGAGKWRTTATVVLPSALPGILTSIVISMGRAAGETAPIIFTAAVSVGKPLKIWQTLTEATPALPWNIYNLATEHEAVDEIRHVQYGMVFTLIALVLILNFSAIALRARIARKLKG